MSGSCPSLISEFALSCVCERAECFLLKILMCSEPNMGFQNSTGSPPFVTGTKVTKYCDFTCTDTEPETDEVL